MQAGMSFLLSLDVRNNIVPSGLVTVAALWCHLGCSVQSLHTIQVEPTTTLVAEPDSLDHSETASRREQPTSMEREGRDVGRLGARGDALDTLL